MVTAVLQTKLFIPPLRVGAILRQHLTRRLGEGLHQGRRLSLISAPAGYGKTSLVVEWIQQARLPVAWLSLDPLDNDPARFWIHLHAALRSIPLLRQAGVGESALSELYSPQLPNIDVLIIDLLNQIAGLPECVLLVLDDLHLITDASIHAGVLFLLEHLPAAPQVLHLVVASRSDPPWPMARLRARADLTELRAPDLRFNLEEVQEFLTRTAGFRLSMENIAALEKRTEGWIAGLQMAALSLQGIQQARGEEAVASFIRSFAGSQRFVLDYLMEEVLSHQPPENQEFLLKTSLLDRLTAPLCDYFLGRSDSQEILTRLERDNLFVNPLDDQRRWYCYHHLFSELLQLRLEQQFVDQMPRLHRQASEWYAQAGYVADAVHHALVAGDHYRVVELVTGNTLALFYSGELPAISKWLKSVPSDVEQAPIWLWLARAWVTAYEGDTPVSETILKAVERVLDKQERLQVSCIAGNLERILGHIAAIRAYCSLLRADFTASIDYVQEALKHLPETDWLTRTFVAEIWASAAQEVGALRRAVEILEENARAIPVAGDLQVKIMALIDLPAHQTSIGQLRSAYATGQRLMQMIEEFTSQSGECPPIAAFVGCRLSYILYEWNELEAAQRYAQESLQISKRWGQKDSQALACDALARVFQAQGKQKEALLAIEDAERLADQHFPLYQATMRAKAASLNLAQGDLTAAVRWADGNDMICRDELQFSRRHAYLAACQVWIEQGRLAEAEDLLQRLASLFEELGSVPLLIKTLALQALQTQARGDREGAIRSLLRALALAEPEGYLRTFLDFGATLVPLLKGAGPRLKADDALQVYIQKLLNAFSAGEIKAAEELPGTGMLYPPSTLPPFPLIEPLSARELEVLRLLNSRLTSAEIAGELVLAVSTVRTHIRNIYGKLGVNRRMEAIERAREFGLL